MGCGALLLAMGRRSALTKLLHVDRDAGASLQAQLREQFATAILSGAAPEGARLPSSRAVAEELGIARNTVTLAYGQLLAEGLVEARTRSGLYVPEQVVGARQIQSAVAARSGEATGFAWAAKLKGRIPRRSGFRCPPDWRRYPYPFVDGRFDAASYPLNDWREAARLALGARDIEDWTADGGEADDAVLIEQIRTKILPRRGINARPEEILITVGTQQALHAITELLADRRTRVAVEEPGYPDLRQMLRRRGADIHHQPVDEQGMVIDDRLDGAELIFATPSHQNPTGATLSLERRRALVALARANDAILVEDDVDCETNYIEPSAPALKALDPDGRVIYVASLSKILGPALRLGFVVGSPDLLEELRKVRRLTVRHPPLTNQRAAAVFLSLGHYDATMLRLCRTFRDRRLALRDALNHYLPHFVDVRLGQGGTALWVRGPEGLKARDLAHQAAKRGVLIEPVDGYYAKPAGAADNVFRLGITSLPLDRIRPGVATLAAVARDLMGGPSERLDTASGERLTGERLRAVMQEAVLLYRTVYGEPCTIELAPDGSMQGRAGFANEDRDAGRWWLEGDVWWRQWDSWAYGEPVGFICVLEGSTLKWFYADGRLIDRAVLAEITPHPAPELAP